MTKWILLLFLIVSNNLQAQEKPEGLFINAKAPEFKGKDQKGNEVALKDLRKKGPVVIFFYRGYWCPFSNKELQRLQDSLALINEKGGQVVAITPEKHEGVAKTIDQTKATYPIITDEDTKIMKSYGVAYQVNDKAIARYKMANIDLVTNNGQKPDAVYLPVTAVYIVGKDGEIKYRFFDPDYKKQALVSDIINNLVGLK